MTQQQQEIDAIGGRARTLALAVVICALVMDIVDLTIVNVAIPTLQSTFGAGQAESQWLVAGYATVFAILLISGGRLGDIYGYRRVLLVGMAAFALASLGCGLAPTPTALVLARLAQGVAAAAMLPQISSLVQVMYPPHERLQPMSLFGVMGGAAAVAGPVIGGLIIGGDWFGLGWRPIFLINVPLGAATIAAGLVLLPEGRSPHALKLDWPGTALAMAAVSAVMVPLVQGREHGWPAWSIALLAISPALMWALLAYSRRRMVRDGSALVVPGLFRDRGYAVGLGIAALFQVALAGLLFVFTQVLQNGFALSPETVGLIHVPYALGASISIGVVARRALPRFGARVVSVGGLLMLFGLALLYAQLVNGIASLALAPTMLVMGLGMGLITGPLGPITMSEVDRAHAGAASGMFKAVQEFGGALGVAIPGGLYLAIAGTGGMRAMTAFGAAAAVIGAALLAVALLARAVPRQLKVFGAGVPGEQPVLSPEQGAQLQEEGGR